MSREKQSSELQRSIRQLLQDRRPSNLVRTSLRTRSLVCGSLMALVMTPGTASAVTLGELSARSRLGQPLKAAIPLRLAAGETISSQCVSSAGGGRDLQGPAGLQFTVPASQGPGNFLLGVSTTRPLVEPMYEISVRLDCQGTARVIRHYVLMLDLPGMAPVLQPGASDLSAGVVSGDRLATTVQPSTRPAAGTTATLQRSRESILPGSAYRVRSGDTLSTIAARIQGRPADSTWRLAGQIFSANPSAFIRNNPDLIKLGSEIRIPEAANFFVPSTSLADASTSTAKPSPVAAASSPQLSQQAVPARIETTIETTSAAEKITRSVSTVALQTDVSATEAASQAMRSEVAAGSASPFAVEPAPQVDTGLAADTADTLPAVTTATVSISESRPASVSPWLAVLLGILLGVALSLVLIRGRVLERVSALLRRPQRGAAALAPDDVFINTDEWLDPRDTEISELPVRNPADETYVVEVAEAEASIESRGESTQDVFSPDPEPLAERTAAEDLSAVSAAAAGEPSEEFVDVFDDAMHGLPSEPDLPIAEFDAALSATVEQPGAAPTEELPHFNSSSLSFNEDAATAELTSLDELNGGETAEMTLDALEAESGDETRLSSTLQEALTLLEQDYEHELTASQVIDQQSIEDALADENAAELQRKLTG